MNELEPLRRASLRWSLLLALHKARPYSTSEVLLTEVARAIYPDATPLEVRQELDYLEDSALLTVTRQPSGQWFADLNAAGVDLVEYTTPDMPGIARPVRYWRT
ncbi:hypothetical protein CBG25_05055 [Arsenophonus sp. ENCA]|uniref:hypothetical protein n=1 Tax=Arsenophonus sp. ENCA TaxID=1987579 RepID=UPI000BCE2626|nr:hypothetical protein [Arsenophonus sp. ENCA]PAV07259.1 hypothetical protein CBG25_05055 [Arsenophonus sp. ENCA]